MICSEGTIDVKDSDLLDIYNLTDNELILVDENLDFAFITCFDSFIILFLAREDVTKFIFEMDLEGIICDENTSINWYFDTYK